MLSHLKNFVFFLKLFSRIEKDLLKQKRRK